ncbi:2-hydroxyglutaryl-CoA dehydratase [Pseudoflavonifractor sp. BIOML-A6]|nr:MULTISPECIES: acyl-CoA dehydratase activase [unclassified Pseudoflavonifractor]MTQ97720.1 2-hydroxyglutaryl-CoA dehydratase [Pseudoflavonifractor sp. BIOML-A16]MTR06707.1 2-hydroxyglutaryl-CoA dehydratase [Pseudoflavonifractor sp. BIOML-A15]MTR33297.1 2-hydroxyglutaryl-CoA dehydratase [Pseudoflavonifractor sp. BIOML-A14]MTR73959.1 2-hydroxyglutaryl-CoA dehydratase [Pseudoflavonifractor sp. BIOML-A18]MTS64729.1 2-hydroxyglutaryl-CoA dehydratase [Pseudoflavonifractor sp. BIOML-A5]MTS72921.1 
MSLRIGIDIGSTTVKVVVLDEDNKLLFRSYERHYSKARERACETLNSIKELLSGKDVKLVITGSAGLGVAKAGGIDFVQEVYATAAAVTQYYPDTDAVIELGGEDAKIIFFGGALEERMNGSCAGGTGAFIDQMATLMNVSVNELDALSLNHEKIYPIASRCGVFAKSDIQPILNQGGRKEDVAASIFQAVVDQTVAGLTQGRELKGKIVFLGGPLHFLMGLRARFVETLHLDGEHAVFPEDGDCFAGIGAALCAADYADHPFDDLLRKLEESVDAANTVDTMPPLFTDEADYAAFLTRHDANHPPEADIHTYAGDAYLGIDAGSTTTKVALIAPDGGLLYTYYHSNQGNPVAIVLEQLKEIYRLCGGRVTIRGSAVTGYGEELIKNAFSCDLGLVETVAHFNAAAHFNPDVDFIIDIGGQDMKCFKIRNGAVDSIMLNEACSSGCGSFIETFAKALGYTIADFAKIGLFAPHPVNLGSRCTVFMNSSVKQAQKDGAGVEDISAGLSISIVKNAVYKVIRAASADDLGRHIVVQGGTFHNDAVLRAFEQELGRNVTRPTIAGLMGAFGAALAARDLHLEKSALLSEKALQGFTHSAKPVTCGLCTNHCSLTVNQFDGGRKFISGNRCSRPLGKEKVELPDLMNYKYKKLRALEGRGSGSGVRGRMGIPFGLNMYENLPFWFEFFTRLNFEVVLSPESTRKLYIKGQHTIPSDTVCYPAKLLHGHVEALVEQGVDAIWYPCMSYNNDEGIGDNHFNCPVVAYYPELLAANMPVLKQTRYLDPYVGLWRRKDFEKRIARMMEEEFSIPKKETAAAVRAAYDAYDAYLADIRATGKQYVEYARANNMPILVVCGRPYHIDPEINHGINDLITSFGFVLVTEDALSHLEGYESRKVLNQWTFQSRMYNAARYVCTQSDMQVVQLVSFGCGTDAITTDELRSILEEGGKLYTQLKIDDINNLGAVRIRIRSLMAAIDARKR